jgi:hypothetical protein
VEKARAVVKWRVRGRATQRAALRREAIWRRGRGSFAVCEFWGVQVGDVGVCSRDGGGLEVRFQVVLGAREDESG